MSDLESQRRSWLLQEAQRVLSEAQLEADPALVAQGWERRFLADRNRVQEATELYTRLGFEVRAEPIKADELDGDCSGCQAVLILQFKTIYTRKRRLPS